MADQMNPHPWRQALQPDRLPIFRHTREALGKLLPRRERISSHEVAQVVLADPLACLLLLHDLNKRVMERYGSEVLSVGQALQMRGLPGYLDGVQKLPVLEDTLEGPDAGPAQRALQALTRQAQHAAWQARDFAVVHADLRAEEVEVAALLAHAPACLLWLRAPDLARRLQRLSQERDRDQAMQEVLGTSRQDFLKQVLTDWSIPPTTLELLAEREKPGPRQTITQAALRITERSAQGWWHEDLQEDYAALAEVVRLPLEQVANNIRNNALRAARQGCWLSAPPAAAWLTMLPGAWPGQAPEQDNAPLEPAQSAQLSPAPDKQVLHKALQGIEQHLDASLDLHQMCTIILKGLHSGLGLSRILFAMRTPDGEKIRSRFTLGIRADDPLRQFEFPLASGDLFGQLMGRMQALWVRPNNRERLLPLVRPELRQAIGPGDFFAMSLHSSAGPIGFIYADRDQATCALDPQTFSDFKTLCIQAAKGLGRLRST